MKAEEPIISYSQLNPDQTYSYQDYITWRIRERIELIRGKIAKMSPAPNTLHQKVSLQITKTFLAYLEHSPCQLFVAPFDVRLPVPGEKKETTVVQPDLCVICDASKLDEKGCHGAPDLVVEILSPGNARHELYTKFFLYEESGVKEYWIVQPQEKIMLVYTLEDGKFIGLPPATEGGRLKSILFPDLCPEINPIFIA